LTLFPEFDTIIEEIQKIEPTKENLFELRKIQAKGTEIATIAAVKVSEIYQEQERIDRQNRELSFSYKRDFHYGQKEEFNE
jgi:hypothetical protein